MTLEKDIKTSNYKAVQKYIKTSNYKNWVVKKCILNQELNRIEVLIYDRFYDRFGKGIRKVIGKGVLENCVGSIENVLINQSVVLLSLVKMGSFEILTFIFLNQTTLTLVGESFEMDSFDELRIDLEIGEEFEFIYKGQQYSFNTVKDGTYHITEYNHLENEQVFSSPQELLEHGKIAGESIEAVWNKVTIV